MELSFAFPRDSRFKDLETGEVLASRPWHIREEYKKLIKEFVDNYKNRCRAERIDYQIFSTDTPYGIALFEFLDRRRRML